MKGHVANTFIGTLLKIVDIMSKCTTPNSLLRKYYYKVSEACKDAIYSEESPLSVVSIQSDTMKTFTKILKQCDKIIIPNGSPNPNNYHISYDCNYAIKNVRCSDMTALLDTLKSYLRGTIDQLQHLQEKYDSRGSDLSDSLQIQKGQTTLIEKQQAGLDKISNIIDNFCSQATDSTTYNLIMDICKKSALNVTNVLGDLLAAYNDQIKKTQELEYTIANSLNGQEIISHTSNITNITNISNFGHGEHNPDDYSKGLTSFMIGFLEGMLVMAGIVLLFKIAPCLYKKIACSGGDEAREGAIELSSIQILDNNPENRNFNDATTQLINQDLPPNYDKAMETYYSNSTPSAPLLDDVNISGESPNTNM